MTNTNEPQLTSELLEDLHNPSISSLELCQLHSLELAQFATVLESETYQQAAAAFERVNTARRTLLAPEAKSLATARLNAKSPGPLATVRFARSNH